jgi:uncharacterized membrane protein
MTNENPQDTLRRVQAELSQVSARLNGLAADFQRLASVLPELQAGRVPQPPASAPQPWAAPQGAPGRPLPPAAHPPYPAPSGDPVRPAAYAPAPAARPQAAQRPLAPVQPAQPSVTPPLAPASPTVALPHHPAPAPRRPRRQVSVAEVFSIFGSAITLIGVAFVLVLPQDGAVGPVARTTIGTVLSVLAVGAALWQHGKDPKNIGAQALMATGVASAFLCVVAVTVLFVGPDGRAMLPELPGLALAGLVSIGGVWIARSWNSQWLAVLAILGSLLLAPYIVRENFVWCLAFMVVMSVVTAAFQRGLAWVWLMAARILPTTVVFLSAVTLPEPSAEAFPLATLGLATLFAAAGLVMAILHQHTSRPEQIASVAFMVLTAGPLMIACWQGDTAPGAVAAAALGAAYAACGLAEKWLSELLRSAAVPLGALFVAFAILRATDSGYQEYIYFGLAAAYLAVARSTRFGPVLAVGFVLMAIGVGHWLPLATTPLAPAFAIGNDVAHVMESLLGLLATLLGALALRAFLVGRPSWLTYATWAASVVFGTVALILAGTLVGERVGDPERWFQAAHAVVTVSWLLLCVVLLRRGLRRDTHAMVSVRLAIALAVAAVAKLFLFDLATLPDLVRAIAFLAVGVLLLVIGTWYNRQLERVRKTPVTVPVEVDVPAGTAAPAATPAGSGRPEDSAPPSAKA